jgi:tetratricopeptide (TPR) repeat protein
MTKKKDTPFQIAQEEKEQVESIVQSYRQRAQNLCETTDRQQVETALADINALPEAAQMALLDALTKESTSQAAVILLAIHLFGALKAVRKEAKRALIRLEGARVYPRWQPPTEQALPVIELTPAELDSARFWQGLVTDSFEAAEVQLMLSWELGPDDKRARIMGFLLDFWGGGVKDFFTEVSSKRHIEDRIAQMRAITRDLNLIPCTLARGRHLIEDALATNKKHGTRPHMDYRLNESLIRHMVLEAVENEEDEEDEDDIDSIAPGMEPLARRFTEGRAEALRYLASGQVGLADACYNEGDEERGEHFEAMAEATLPESLTLEDHYLTHTSLAELLTRKDFASEEDEDKALDEAVAHLRHALTLVTDANIQAEIEHKLAEIAGEREQDGEAILHYRRMTELQPDNVDPWMHLGDTYRNIDNFEEAEASYRRALELDSHLVDAYDGLASVYTTHDEKARAIKLLEEGIRNNPDSAAIHALTAVTLVSNGQYQRAKALLKEAERIDPKWAMLPVYHARVDTHKPKPSLPTGGGQRGQRSGKPGGKKHRKR